MVKKRKPRKDYFPLFPFFCEIHNGIREKCWKLCRKRGGSRAHQRFINHDTFQRPSGIRAAAGGQPQSLGGGLRRGELAGSIVTSEGAAGTAREHRWEIPQGAMTILGVSVNGSGAGVLAAPSRSTQPGCHLCRAATGAAAAGSGLAPSARQPDSTFPLSPLFVVKMADL